MEKSRKRSPFFGGGGKKTTNDDDDDDDKLLSPSESVPKKKKKNDNNHPVVEVIDLSSSSSSSSSSMTPSRSRSSSKDDDKHTLLVDLLNDEDEEDDAKNNETSSSTKDPFQSTTTILPQQDDSSIQNDHDKIKEESSSSSSKSNPFAQFAFTGCASIPAPPPTRNVILAKRPVPNSHESSSNSNPVSKPAKKPKQTKKDCKEFIRMKDYSVEEQERIRQKWLRLATDDTSTTTLQDRRFQMLLAARLHARVQEPNVIKALDKLRQRYRPLSVATLQRASPDDVAACISNVPYYNTKAKDICTAAQEIQTRFGGIVPEDEHSLLQIRGIGPVFADVLAFCNTTNVHLTNENQKLQEQEQAVETTSTKMTQEQQDDNTNIDK